MLRQRSGCSAVGSARALGARCRRFESCHSDQKKKKMALAVVFFFFDWDGTLKLFCVAKAGSHTEGITKRSGVILSLRPSRDTCRIAIKCLFPFRSDSSLRCLLRKPNLVSPLANVSFRPNHHDDFDRIVVLFFAFLRVFRHLGAFFAHF